MFVEYYYGERKKKFHKEKIELSWMYCKKRLGQSISISNETFAFGRTNNKKKQINIVFLTFGISVHLR